MFIPPTSAGNKSARSMPTRQVRLSTDARTYNVVFPSSNVRVATHTTSSPRSQLDPQAIAAVDTAHRTHAHSFRNQRRRCKPLPIFSACAASETISTTAIQAANTTSSPQVTTQATTRTPAQSHKHGAAILCASDAPMSSRSPAVSSLATHLASKDTAPTAASTLPLLSKDDPTHIIAPYSARLHKVSPIFQQRHSQAWTPD
ncbi:hypothetical protein B0T12DRAFT_33203 [Alternaria alternata]|jgi:hypothetical protein|nr:hypothetical protein B0T12DRAFT_33203 [Alternaria alternata]